jgi:hypothetical protein
MLTGRSWQELTWSWAYLTGHSASDQKLETAAKAAWSYALLCASTYLNDRDAAHELMDHAVKSASRYATRHPDRPSDKLTSHIKSVIRCRVKELAAKRNHELPYGSLHDLEQIYAGQPDAEQRIYANELIERLSPFAQSIVNRRLLGYTWREIAKQLEMDHTAVRRAYYLELNSVLQSFSRRGAFPACD